MVEYTRCSPQGSQAQTVDLIGGERFSNRLEVVVVVVVSNAFIFCNRNITYLITDLVVIDKVFNRIKVGVEWRIVWTVCSSIAIAQNIECALLAKDTSARSLPWLDSD